MPTLTPPPAPAKPDSAVTECAEVARLAPQFDHSKATSAPDVTRASPSVKGLPLRIGRRLTLTVTIHLAQLSPPAAGDPSPAMRAIAAIATQVCQETIGVDLTDPAETLVAKYGNQDSARKFFVAALASTPATESGELGLPLIASSGTQAPLHVLGYLYAQLPLKDNQHLMEVTIEVSAAHRRRGIGTSLLGVARQIAAAHGRRTLIGWSAHRPVLAGGEPLRPATGVGEIPRDATATFLLRRGFNLEQAEQRSILRLPVPPSVLSGLQAGVPADSDYRVVQWEGATPPALRTHLARLREAMSTDIPSGALEVEKEQWDEERISKWDAMATIGTRRFTTAVEHQPTGDLVAYTEIGQIISNPAHAYQEDTLVVGAHRGHRLGLVCKLANLEFLAREAPAVAAIHTWNAGENDPMLSINRALGFQPGGWEGVWESKL